MRRWYREVSPKTLFVAKGFYGLMLPGGLIMIAIGAAVGFWIPFRRTQEQPSKPA